MQYQRNGSLTGCIKGAVPEEWQFDGCIKGAESVELERELIKGENLCWLSSQVPDF